MRGRHISGNICRMRYLTFEQASQALGRGRQVEQFLGGVDGAPVAAVRWATISPDTGAFRVVIHEVEDVGGPDFLDVTEFPPLGDEEHPGEGRLVASAPGADSALDLANEVLGTDPDRWVNSSVVSDEYRDFRGWTVA